ncbi:hypothetical protein ACHQM5_022428 [Ranunculus cassubicifolius]
MGDRSADGVLKSRPVLADVSNQLGKRRFVSISTSSGSNNGSENQKNGENEVGKVIFTRKDFTGVENLGKGKCVYEFGGKGDTSVLKPKEMYGSWNLNSGVKSENFRFGNAKPFGVGSLNLNNRVDSLQAAKKPSSLSKGYMLFSGGNAMKKGVENSGDRPKETSFSSGSMPRASGNCDNAQSTLVVADDSDEETSSDSEFTRNHGGSNIRGSSVEGMEAYPTGGSLPSSQEGDSEKCAFLNFDGTPNTTMGTDFLKTCSCSFCLKAAYIWTDLQYQDTKGRIAALKRSRKDVRSVIEKSCTYGGFGKNVNAISTKPTKLEHDLMGQWRSLFLHTEDVLIRESSQLQSSLLNLKDLRDNCKSDLEMTSGIQPSNS